MAVCSTRLNEQWLFFQHGCQTGLYNRFDSRIERTVAVRSTRLSNLFDNWFDNQLDVCLHDTAGCQTGCITGVTAG